MNHFLIIQTAFLGDVILCTPLISELKRIYPDAVIDVLVRKGNEILLQNNPGINKVFVFNKNDPKLYSLKGIIREVRKVKYDEVINLQRYTSAGIICLFARTKYRIGFTKNALPFIYNKRIKHSIDKGEHEVVRNLKTIAHHGANKIAAPKLFPSREAYKAVEKFKETSYYCLAPASVWYTKQLPKEKWVELIHLLIEKGNILLIGGPNDRNLCAEIAAEFNTEKVINLAGKYSLLESAALMESATINYVNDSGPQHIASAMNAPVIAFFCSTIPDFGFGPLSEKSKIVQTDEELSCKPCGIHGYNKCPKDHFKCGKNIKITENLTEITLF